MHGAVNDVKISYGYLLADPVSSVPTQPISTGFSISHIRPNPISSPSKPTLRFSTAAAGEYLIGIYDISGKLVSDWTRVRYVEPGVYDVQIDLEAIASSGYFCRLISTETGASTGEYFVITGGN